MSLGFVLSAAVLAAPLGRGVADAASAAPAGLHSVGLFDPSDGSWYLRDGSGGTTRLEPFGGSGDVPLMGDWDGDGIDSPGLYRPEEGRLVMRNGSAAITLTYPMPEGGLAVAGDWDGDGRDTVSVARAGRLYVMDGLGRGPEALGGPDPLPVRVPVGTEALLGGDFDGDGNDEVAAVAGGRVVAVGSSMLLGDVGPAMPVVGDWDGNGIDTLGAYNSWRAEFRLFGDNGEPVSVPMYYGATGMVPVAGAFGDLPGGDAAPVFRAGLPAMDLGEEGSQVLLLQQELARLHFYRGPMDGVFSPATSYAVMAFHKVMGVERTWVWEEGDSRRMAGYSLPPLPVRPNEPDRVEVDLGRQVLYIFRGGAVVEILPISSGGGYRYYSDYRQSDVWAITPIGDFHLYRHVVGWDYVVQEEDDVGRCRPYEGDYCVYSPWNISAWVALHGYDPVPEVPVSHGCIRITLWDSDAIEDVLFIGMPLHVWDTYPAE